MTLTLMSGTGAESASPPPARVHCIRRQLSLQTGPDYGRRP
jgi:hypothetical protein